MKITPHGLIPILVALSLLAGGSAVFADSDPLHTHISGHEDFPGTSCDDGKCGVHFSGWTTSDSLTWLDDSDGGSWSITLDYQGGTGICDRSWITGGTWHVNGLSGNILGETETLPVVYSWVIWPEGHGTDDCTVDSGDFPYGGVPNVGDPNHAGYDDDAFDVNIDCAGFTDDVCLSPKDNHPVAKFFLLLDGGSTIQGCLDDMHLPSNPFRVLRNPPKVWGCGTIPTSGGSVCTDPPRTSCEIDSDCCSDKCKGPRNNKICR